MLISNGALWYPTFISYLWIDLWKSIGL